jgi:DNA-binding MarR family transcriptional regulator
MGRLSRRVNGEAVGGTPVRRAWGTGDRVAMKAKDEGGRDVIDRHVYAPHYLVLIANALASGASRLYFDHLGFGVNEARILAILGHNGQLTQPQMSGVLVMNKSIVSRSLQTLLDRRLVEPMAASRPQLFQLTEAGYVAHAVVVKISLDRENLLFDGIDADQREQLLTLLKRMLDNMANVNRYTL